MEHRYDVCIKRKIRNRMQDMGYSIFVQANARIDDQKKSLEGRFKAEFKSPKEDPDDVISMQITRSTNGMAVAEKGRSKDTMGMKHLVDFGVYKVKGSISAYFAEKTGFTGDDAKVIREALCSLFVNDASAARPEGSMEVKTLYWFTHPSKLGVASSAKVYDLIEEKELVERAARYEDYEIKLNEEKLAALKEKGLKVEVFEGL